MVSGGVESTEKFALSVEKWAQDIQAEKAEVEWRLGD